MSSPASDPNSSQYIGTQSQSNPQQNTAKSSNDPSTTGSTTQTPLAIIGTQTLTTLPGEGIGIGSVTIKPGDAPITVNNIPIAMSSSAVFVGGSSIALPLVTTVTVSPVPLPSINGQGIQAASKGGVVVAGATLAQGANTVVDSTPISVGASIVILGSSTFQISSMGVSTPAPLPPIGGQQIQSNGNGGLVISGSNIDPGQKVTIHGTSVLVGSSCIVVGNSVYALPGTIGNTIPLPSIGGQKVQALDNGVIGIRISTITLGQQATISGIPVAVGPVNVVTGTSTIPLAQAGASPVSLPSVGGQALTMGTEGGIVVVGSTLAPGQQATILGTPISVGTGNIVIGSSTISLPRKDSSVTLPSVGGQSLIPVSNGGVAIFGTTLVQGQATTISGTPVSIGTSSIVIGSSTFAIPTQGSPNILPSVGGQALTMASNGGLVFGATTLSPGQQITFSGTPVSIGTGNVVIGSKTFPLSLTPSPQIPGLVFAGQTLHQGSVIFLAGTPVSYGASDLVIGTYTIPIPSSAIQSVFTVADQVFTGNPTAFSVAGITVSKNGPGITLSGTPVSFGPAGIIIGSSKEQLALPSVFTIAGQTFTANPTAFSIAGTTISDGGPGITLGGTPISLAPNELIIGTSTQELAFQSVFIIGGQTYTASLEPGTTTQPSPGIGGLIWSAFNPSGAGQVGVLNTTTMTASGSLGGFGSGTMVSTAPPIGSKGSGSMSGSIRSTASAQTGAALNLRISWFMPWFVVICIGFCILAG